MTHRFETSVELHGERDEVFRAWLDPERLVTWFRPSDTIRAVGATVDAREGGSFAIRLRTEEDAPIVVRGTYRAIEPGRRLVFSHLVHWGAEDPGDVEGAPVVTVDFEEASGAIRVLVTEEEIPDEATARILFDSWHVCLGRLAGALDSSLDVFFERVTRTPRTHSPFGGFWPDYSNAAERRAGKRELGWLTEEDERLFEHWTEKGYVHLEGACSAADVDRFNAEVDDAWQGGLSGLRVEHFPGGKRRSEPIRPELRAVQHKVLEVHGHSQTARDLVFAPPIRRFLQQLFERPVMAFQSLLFEHGSEQEMHQDSAYVLLTSPLEFVGCWIALEDVRPGSGELRYYEGSHRIEEYLWFGRARAKPYDYHEDGEFLTWVRERSEQAGLVRREFLPKKGDALIWHADLVHGGAPRVERELTRRSLVTHLCPVDVDPEWFGTTDHSEKLRDASGSYYCFRRDS